MGWSIWVCPSFGVELPGADCSQVGEVATSRFFSELLRAAKIVAPDLDTLSALPAVLLFGENTFRDFPALLER
jgi:hypothetical protein